MERQGWRQGQTRKETGKGREGQARRHGKTGNETRDGAGEPVQVRQGTATGEDEGNRKETGQDRRNREETGNETGKDRTRQRTTRVYKASEVVESGSGASGIGDWRGSGIGEAWRLGCLQAWRLAFGWCNTWDLASVKWPANMGEPVWRNVRIAQL